MSKSQITFKYLCEKIQGLEYDDYINDITDEEAKEVAIRCLQWFIDNKLDNELLDYFLADVRGQN